MKAEHSNVPLNIPSTRNLIRATAIAVAVAAVVLVTVVLPAEYGLDPLGTGKVLGLTVLTDPVAAPPPVVGDGEVKLIPVQNGPAALYPSEFRVDSRRLVLGPYEYIEFKYRLEQGATMLFSWKASGDVAHDFHGDADGAPADASQSYDKQTRRSADGTFIAPFSGIHGWFWENPGGEEMAIALTAAGFFTTAYEFHSDRTRRQHEVGRLDRIAVAPNQKEFIQ
jgi:hypothetical protein